MRKLALIACLAAGPAFAEVELKNELSFESGLRDSGRFDVNRTAFQLSAKQAWERAPLEFAAELRAWQNVSHENFGLNESEVALRVLKVSYWGRGWGLTGGLQQINWSETFGLQAVDLVNARNFVDFSPLDHGRNRLPTWNLNGYVDVGPFKLTGYLSPQGQIPTLPGTFQGVSLRNDESSGRFGVYPEGGARLSATLADANGSLFAYRHLNRIPSLRVVPGTTPTLQADYRPVTSLGGTFSRGFSEIVVRADGVVTLDHPTPAGVATVYNFAAGLDWSPEALEDFTIGVQGQFDRFPVANGEGRAGASLMARKGLWRGRFELEARAFSRFNTTDYWLQGSGRLRLGDSWEWRVTGETLGDDKDSPLSLLGYRSRVSTQVSLFF